MSKWFNGRRGQVALILSNLLVAGIAFLVARWPASGGVEILPPAPTATALPSPTASPVRVYVSGAVIAPGVYTLPPGSIAQDALDLAGGPAEGADLPAINLALPLSNGQQVNVPRIGDKTIQKNTPTAAPTMSGPVNVNTASAAELETLPSIGPVLAERIIQYRQEHGPFRTVDALLLVPGIGPATLERFRELIALD
jgi:competence protein ComEA